MNPNATYRYTGGSAISPDTRLKYVGTDTDGVVEMLPIQCENLTYSLFLWPWTVEEVPCS